jgi:hypothetical protein
VFDDDEYIDNDAWIDDPDDEDWGEQEGDDMSETKTVSTEDEGIEELRTFIKTSYNSERVAHSILARDNTSGELKAVLKPSRPCYGELRRYGPSSTRPGDGKPGDLSQPLDFDYRGLAIGIPFQYHGYGIAPETTEFNAERSLLLADTVLNEDTSPWKAVLKGREIVYGDDGTAKGFILKDPDIDSSWAVSLALNIRYFNMAAHRHRFLALTYESLGVPLAFLMSFGAVEAKKNPYYTPPEEGLFWALDGFEISYHLDDRTPIENFVEGKLTHINPGNFSEGYDYNRPELSYTFFNPTDDYLATPEHTRAWVRSFVQNNKDTMSRRIKTALDNIHAPYSKLFDIQGVRRYNLDYIVEHAQELKDAILSRSGPGTLHQEHVDGPVHLGT